MKSVKLQVHASKDLAPGFQISYILHVAAWLSILFARLHADTQQWKLASTYCSVSFNSQTRQSRWSESYADNRPFIEKLSNEVAPSRISQMEVALFQPAIMEVLSLSSTQNLTEKNSHP